MAETTTHPPLTTSAPHQGGHFRVPSIVLVIGSILGFQLGTVLAKPAVEAVGPVDSAFVRLVIGATFLLAWTRPSLATIRQNLRLILVAGLGMIATTVMMLGAIERIPVGIAVAIEFWGPMALAVKDSRHRRDLVWVALALCGILLFTPLADASFDGVGVLLAVGAGACFGAMLVIQSRLGLAVGGVRAGALAMAAAAIGLAPVSLATGLDGVFESTVITHLVVAALFTNCLGVTLEYTALTRIRPSLYAILICLEPAVGTVLAWIILDETIGAIGLLGMLLVSIAAVGATRASNEQHL
jgi:inner membrane transporter RhtA